MEYLEIGLLVLGALFFIGSFFVQEKLSSSDVDEIKKMSEKQINALMEKQLRDADVQIDNRIGNKLNESLEKLERESDKETNEKLMSIGEYSDTVMEKMDKTHEEIMFIYQMLNEKQDKLTQLTKDAQDYESHLRGISEEMQKTVSAQAAVQAAPEPQDAPEPAPGPIIMAVPVEDTEPDVPSAMETYAPDQDKKDAALDELQPASDTQEKQPEAEKAPASKKSSSKESKHSSKKSASKESSSSKKAKPKVALDASDDDNKEQIISMFKQGYTQVEIAKKIGVGLGEIQLILGLYGEGK